MPHGSCQCYLECTCKAANSYRTTIAIAQYSKFVAAEEHQELDLNDNENEFLVLIFMRFNSPSLLLLSGVLSLREKCDRRERHNALFGESGDCCSVTVLDEPDDSIDEDDVKRLLSFLSGGVEGRLKTSSSAAVSLTMAFAIIILTPDDERAKKSKLTPESEGCV